MNTLHPRYESTPVTCHNSKNDSLQTRYPHAITRGIPIPAVVDNGQWFIPLTSSRMVVAFALVDAEDAPLLEQYRWQLLDRREQGRASYALRPVTGAGSVYMHRQLLGLGRADKREVDHVNRDGLDNRRANLRIVTHAENHQNRAAQQRNALGHRGVRRAGRKFHAQVTLDGFSHDLGYYPTTLDAAVAACAWRAQHMPFSTHCGLPSCLEGLETGVSLSGSAFQPSAANLPASYSAVTIASVDACVPENRLSVTQGARAPSNTRGFTDR